MSYADCLETEGKSRAILEPLFDFHSGNRMVVLEHCAAAAQLQRIADLAIGRRTHRGAVTLELKAEEHFRGNLFIEEFSNLNIGSAAARDAHPSRLGWGLTCGADVLAYHFLDKNRLYLVGFQALLVYVFGCKPNGQIRAGDYSLQAQRKHRQMNNTVGLLVSVAHLQKALGEQFQFLEVGSLLDAEYIGRALGETAAESHVSARGR
jgi:hypothetical protein